MDVLKSRNRAGRINVPNNVTDAQAVAAAGIQPGSITREQCCPQIEKADGSDKRDLFQFLVMDQVQICGSKRKPPSPDADLSSNFRALLGQNGPLLTFHSSCLIRSPTGFPTR